MKNGLSSVVFLDPVCGTLSDVLLIKGLDSLKFRNSRHKFEHLEKTT